MRVFRKRQLRLREEDNRNTLQVHVDPNRISAGTKDVINIARTTKYPIKMTAQSGSSTNTGTVVDSSANVNTTPNATKAMSSGYRYQKQFDGNGNPVTGSNNNSETNESIFASNLIEGAVMFSKRELRDFLKRI